MNSLRRMAVAVGGAAAAATGLIHLVIVPIAYLSAVDVMFGNSASWTFWVFGLPNRTIAGACLLHRSIA